MASGADSSVFHASNRITAFLVSVVGEQHGFTGLSTPSSYSTHTHAHAHDRTYTHTAWHGMVLLACPHHHPETHIRTHMHTIECTHIQHGTAHPGTLAQSSSGHNNNHTPHTKCYCAFDLLCRAQGGVPSGWGGLSHPPSQHHRRLSRVLPTPSHLQQHAQVGKVYVLVYMCVSVCVCVHMCVCV